MNIIAYAFDADVHCPGCTKARPKRVLTTGSFWVLQFNPGQKPFVVFGIVPQGVVEQSENQPFGDTPA